MKSTYSISLLFCCIFKILGQETLSSRHLEEEAFRFSLSYQNEITGEARTKILDLIGDSQFVGIAEVHQSAQLSFLTAGLLTILKEKDFGHLALEIGPNSAEVLQRLSKNPAETKNKLRQLNNAYGKNAFSKVPIMFTDKIEDVSFIEKASSLGYTFWGLDQEYSASYEMHLDNLYKLADEQNQEFQNLYRQSKAILRKSIFKNKVSGQGRDCWLLENETLIKFFHEFEENIQAQKIIHGMRKSWDIYCRYQSGRSSNQVRANYMKDNFDSLYSIAISKESTPKVIVKLGGIHLTHGKSPFGVNDVGMHLHEKSLSNNSEFISIRHLIAYRNGRSNIGRSGWKGVGMFLELGRKDQWTLVDLRPFREKLLRRELVTDKKYTHELTSYDILLIPPDDRVSKINY